ncbi:MAG: HEPN domain-containing protein [Gammaproteobacteria bacterium]|nr:HEPN domain-containing protein [Gammaproteobacteria bacterium]
MTVSPDALLTAAEAMGLGSDEVDWRNATSRAYYAAFHRSRFLIEEQGLQAIRSHSAHLDVIEALTNSANSNDLRSIGHMLNFCRMLRIVADYEIQDAFPKGDAETALEQARRVLAKAAAVP